MPKILIIIVTWNKKEYVLNLLASLKQLDYAQNALDILVVDNCSDDDTADQIIKNYPIVKVIVNSENLGGTGGFNTGLSWAFDKPDGCYDYIWLLDNDVIVHRKALIELVQVLEREPDAAVAGSTILQLDCPWRVNEIGAHICRATGQLKLNYHLAKIPAWKGKKRNELIDLPNNEVAEMLGRNDFVDVEYVAAASLLVRSEVAKNAGLWMDFFIHFDDVEWCLRIGEQGYRIIASTRSMIWHLSALTKIPTWILYYDNRNVLHLLKAHGANNKVLLNIVRRILKKGLYYAFMGKNDISRLHMLAVEDFLNQKMGAKRNLLNINYVLNKDIKSLIDDDDVKRILIPWTINLQKYGLQKPLVLAALERRELEIHFLVEPGKMPKIQFPNPKFVFLSKYRLLRILKHFILRIKKYDIIFQSEYQTIVPLSLVGRQVVFINQHSFCVHQRPNLNSILSAVYSMFRLWWNKLGNLEC